MAHFKFKPKKDPEIPSSSMADIAFLILIFFMVSTTIDMDKGIGLILPPSGEQKFEVNKEMLTNILVDAQGQILLDDEKVELYQIRYKVETVLANKPKMIFSVKTHEKTKYQTYISVIDQLKQANATNISIAE